MDGNGSESATTPEKQKEENDDKNEIQPAATVVAPAWAGVESSATNQKDQNDENQDHVLSPVDELCC
jgi:hypothetical protein